MLYQTVTLLSLAASVLALPTNPARESTLVSPSALIARGLSWDSRCPDLEGQKIGLPVPEEIQRQFIKASSFPKILMVKNLGSGGAGCVYGLIYNGKIVAVIKTSLQGYYVKQSEIDGLTTVGEYYGQFGVPELSSDGDLETLNERLYLAYKFIPGVQMFKTEGWALYVSPTGKEYRDEGMVIEKCISFLQDNVFKTIKATALNYAMQFENIQHDDLYAVNIHFPKNYKKHDVSREWHMNGNTFDYQAQFIDWDLWVKAESPETAWEQAVDGDGIRSDDKIERSAYYDERGYPRACRVPLGYEETVPGGLYPLSYAEYTGVY